MNEDEMNEEEDSISKTAALDLPDWRWPLAVAGVLLLLVGVFSVIVKHQRRPATEPAPSTPAAASASQTAPQPKPVTPEQASLKAVLDTPTISVFLGTLPLLFAIIWGLLQNDKRLGRIESKLDSVDLKTMSISERLVAVETRLDGGGVIISRR